MTESSAVSDVGAVSSTAESGSDNTGSESGSESSSGSNEGLSFRERATKFLSQREKPVRGKVEAESDSSSDEVEASEEEQPRSQVDKNVDKSKEKSEVDPAIQKMQGRISKITAKFHDAAKQLQSSQVELAKRDKAIEMLQKEVQRLARLEKIDPRDLKLREYETEREVKDFLSNIKEPDLVSQEFESELALQERVDGLVSEVKGLAETYYLVSPQEILLQMQKDGRPGEAIAKEMHQARLNKARAAAPAAPRTVANTGESSREQPSSGDLRTDMRRFFQNQIKSRG